MNEKKKTSLMKSSACEYSVPKVKVMEIEARRVVCASYDGVSGTGEETDMP